MVSLRSVKRSIHGRLQTKQKSVYPDGYTLYHVRPILTISCTGTGLILGLHPANERCRHKVTASLTG